MNHLKVLLSTLFAFAVLFAMTPAMAQVKGEFQTACGKDVKKHCKGVKKGKGRLLKCIRKVAKGKRTKACSKYLAKRAKARNENISSRVGAKKAVSGGLSNPGYGADLASAGSRPTLRKPGATAGGAKSNEKIGIIHPKYKTGKNDPVTKTSVVLPEANTANSVKPKTDTGSSIIHPQYSGSCNTSDRCVETNDCCPDATAQGDRLKILVEAKRILEGALKKRGDKCNNEKTLYYPRQCSGFVIDAFYSAGLISVEDMKHYDWNAEYPKTFRNCSGTYQQTVPDKGSWSAKSKADNLWRPNMNVSYMRDQYCKNRSGSNYSTDGGCAHPWFKEVKESDLKPGDLWLSNGHVGIVYDVKRKIIIHNGTSTGPTMDRWDTGWIKNNEKGVIFRRHYKL